MVYKWRVWQHTYGDTHAQQLPYSITSVSSVRGLALNVISVRRHLTGDGPRQHLPTFDEKYASGRADWQRTAQR